MKTTIVKAIILLIVAAWITPGCVVSYSISRSVRNCSKSSSNSFSTSSLKQLYSSDIKDATLIFAGSAQNSDQFLRTLGSIAAEHGITDWEQDATTYQAIGMGLRQAGYPASGLQDIAFVQPLLTKPDSVQLILAGLSY